MRYFIGYGLHDADKIKVDEFRNEISSIFSVFGALSSPPHITVVPPFETENSEILKTQLSIQVGEQESFSVETPRFHCFDQKVWFLDVEQRDELMVLKRNTEETIKRSLGIREMQNYKPTHFHITLAYKDISPDLFARIGIFLESKNPPITSLTIDNLTLFRFQDGRWFAESMFGFKKPS